MSSDEGDVIGAALHADAEVARAEIRGEGIVCPSCGVNMADLPEDHELPLPVNLGAPGQIVTCSQGATVSLPDCKSDAGFEVCQAVANVHLWGEWRKAEYAAFAAILGDSP